MMAAWTSQWNRLRAELRVSRRMKWGLALIALVLLVEGGLRWSDSISAQQLALTQLQTELASLKTGARNEGALRASLADAERRGKAIDDRLWTVSSEAVGQAQLKDWLTEIVKRSIADQYMITLANSRELTRPSVDGGVPGQDRELRATISFRLTPRALEGVLLEIEAGEPFAAVETLVVKRQERRVELGIRVLVRIQPTPVVAEVAHHG